MCGRYTRYLTWAEIDELHRLTTGWETGRNTDARYNIAPTQTVEFIIANGDGNHALKEGRWWLVPCWAKEIPKKAMFNARIETADTSGAFKDAFNSKRCLMDQEPWRRRQDPDSSTSTTSSRSRPPGYGRTTTSWT